MADELIPFDAAAAAGSRLPSAVRTEISAVAGGLQVLVYTSGAYPARPSVPAGRVRYVGPVQPTTWLTGDEWVNNA